MPLPLLACGESGEGILARDDRNEMLDAPRPSWSPAGWTGAWLSAAREPEAGAEDWLLPSGDS
jgi:hypothetical protein